MTPWKFCRKLTPGGTTVLGQLFVNGPTWDGNIVSKPGRAELVALQLAKQESGFSFLTAEGVQVAVEWEHSPEDLKDDFRARWHMKACGR